MGLERQTGRSPCGETQTPPSKFPGTTGMVIHEVTLQTVALEGHRSERTAGGAGWGVPHLLGHRGLHEHWRVTAGPSQGM